MAEPRPPRDHRPVLHVGHVAGVTLTKWRVIWDQRFPDAPLEVTEVDAVRQRGALDDGTVDVCFVRTGAGSELDNTGLHLIPLYVEVPVVVVPKDHPVSLFDEIGLADLSEENLLDAAGQDPFDLVAGGAGVLLVPHAIARAQSRRDLVYRPVRDADPTQVWLGWLVDNPHPSIQDFIGVVRGRTVNSSRNARPEAPPVTKNPARRPPPRKASPPKPRTTDRRPPRRRGRP